MVVKSLAENLPLELTECRELLQFEVMPENTNLLRQWQRKTLLNPYWTTLKLSQALLYR